MRKIWIDCDTGTDDAIALFTALYYQNELEIVGVSAVAGNAPLSSTFPNTRNVLALAERSDIPVYKGAEKPLERELVTAAYAHGANGLNGVELPNSDAAIEEKEAWKAMAEAVETYPNEMDIVAVGPLTNVALLLKNAPELKEKISRILVMGGGITKGNITPYAEFNIYVDPEAANIVFNSGIPVVMFGLDVTEKGYLLKEEFKTACASSSKKSIFFAEIFREYQEWFENDATKRKYFHDSNPIVYIVEPELFEGKISKTHVICDNPETLGQTVADFEAEDGNVLVILEVNRPEFAQRIVNAVSL